MKANLALYANTALPLAGQVTESEAEAFFASDAFKDHVKLMEHRDKLTSAMFDRFDAVIKSIGNLGKGIAMAVKVGRRGR